MSFKIKAKSELKDLHLNVFNDAGEKIAYLELVTESDLDNVDFIEKVTLWREINKACFLSEFVPTFDRTRQWIKSAIIENQNRLLFKIYTIDDSLVGHIGAISKGDYVEYDYYILGKKVGIKDFAINIARQFLVWVSTLEKFRYILGNVRSDNAHAIDFHLRTGFKIQRKIPLKKIIVSDTEFRFETDNTIDESEVYIVEIRAEKQDLEIHSKN